MKKIKWSDFLRLKRDIKEQFIGFVVDKNNVATCYESGEEKKYQVALKKAQKNQEDV
jgi:hypothetical protein